MRNFPTNFMPGCAICFCRAAVCVVYAIYSDMEDQCAVNCCTLCSQLVADSRNNQSNGTSSITQAEAYGYGFVMIFTISLVSLLGVAIVPLIRTNSRLATIYKCLITLLISMGVAALVTDALLHLIPHALKLHHSDDMEDSYVYDERDVIWKMCVVLGGVVSFFVLEILLHICSRQMRHSHGEVPSTVENSSFFHSDSVALIPGTLPNSDKKQSNLARGEQDYGTVGEHITETAPKQGCCSPITSIKPLAWVILVGDGLHNFTDGVAVGVAISQTLGLGLSTALAILFHEIPHELSDYAILLHTGMSWYKALILNFLSALTALVGFFIGVAIGTDSEATNEWLLAVIAGQFLYIALVDLLPEVLHTEDKGWRKCVHLLMTFSGFSLGFVILLLIALYEDSIDLSTD